MENRNPFIIEDQPHHDPAGRVSLPSGAGIRVEESVTIRRSALELFLFWRNFSNLPRVMAHLESVTPLSNDVTHWVARGPLGQTLEWDAQVTQVIEPQSVAWRSIVGSQVDTVGSVHFEPTAAGTIVKVTLKYDPPGGVVAATVAKWFGQDAASVIRKDLARWKQWMETGTLAPAAAPDEESATGAAADELAVIGPATGAACT